jgi:hypothetical protein
LTAPFNDEFIGGGDEIPEECRLVFASALAPSQSSSDRDNPRDQGLEQCSSEQRILWNSGQEVSDHRRTLLLSQRATEFEERNDVSQILDDLGLERGRTGLKQVGSFSR